MVIEKEYIRGLLKSMNYKLINGSNEIYEKKYIDGSGYFIQVDFEKETINYETIDKDKSIKVSSKTTTNFSQPENFVVLECVDRLIEKGYAPNSIELEHTWPSGHGTSGRLDIVVNKDGHPYLMIECKTYGKEYKKEKENMLQTSKTGDPKGQLFSYCFQEKTTEYLCLYASKLDEDVIRYENAIIKVDEVWRTLPNQKALFDYWNKAFKYNGIFENNVKPYNVECKALVRRDLQRITDADSSRIFNQFLEILRHNSVSDKPNAFNKILNLFICKIIDEDRNDDEELLFQWKDDSTYISLQSNLEDLYKQGMNKFLDICVTDYSDNEIDKKLVIVDNDSKAEIKRMFQELRLQKNPEFAFKEVYNEESFNENSKVVKEVAQLLQPFQFRYGHKQQFLGNFFELLLNTSIKQESGQFFTPAPIAKFMISSLPIQKKIDKKVKLNNKELLPVVIDYACGSGHFLTEYMDIVQTIINSYNTNLLKKSIKNTFEKWKQSDDENSLQGEFEWAKNYVYGIEKDYRLVKTTKISTFLNGDGDANIIHADGLNKFSSNKYKGLLSGNSNVNNNFDFVIANPPYSVSSFKQTLDCDSTDFELFNLLTENSSEIECLFVERTAQLLKDDGYASIILPSSILTNSNNLTEKTKEILLKNFYIKAISKMGSNTFMATGTNTIILFLSKRSDSAFKIAEKAINDFMKSFVDFSFNDTKNVISKYVEAHFDEFSIDEYVSLLNRRINDTLINLEYYNDFKAIFYKSKKYKEMRKKRVYKDLNEDQMRIYEDNLFYDLLIETEKRKLTYYLLTFSNNTLLIDTGEKQAEKDFLGYEFSNRRGSEGIHYFTDNDGELVSSLYDENNLFSNDEKVNYYIRESFENEYPQTNECLKNNIKLIKTSELIRFSNLPFDLTMMLEPNINITIDSKYNKKKLGKLCFIQKGTTITEKQTKQGDIPVVAGGKKPAYYHDTSNREANVITVSGSGANAGYVNYWKNSIFASDCSTIISKNETILKTQYLYILLNEYQEELYKLQKGQGQPHVYPEDLSKIKIPVPPIGIQESIIKIGEELTTYIENLNENITDLKEEINNKTSNFFGTVHKLEKLSSLASISRGASPRPIRKFLTKGSEGINWIKIGDVKSNEKYIVSTKQKITKEGADKSVRVNAGEVIISNSMSIGRPYILGIDGCIHDGWLLISKISDDVLRDYLFYVLSNEYTQNQFSDKAVGSVVENLNIERVGKVTIPLPDKSVQEDFLREVDKLETDISKIELQINLKIVEEKNRIKKLLY